MGTPPIALPPGASLARAAEAMGAKSYREASRPGALVFEQCWRAMRPRGESFAYIAWGLVLGVCALSDHSTHAPPWPVRCGVAVAAIVVVYFGLARLVNRTRIHVTNDALRLSHGPLPWPGSARIPSRRLDVQVRERRNGRKVCDFEVWLSSDLEPRRVLVYWSRDEAERAARAIHELLRSDL